MALSKREISFYRSLQHKKFRQKYKKFTAEGDKIAREVLHQLPDHPVEILALPSWMEAVRPTINDRSSVQWKQVTERELAQISGLSTPNQVVLVLDTPIEIWQHLIKPDRLHLYLDGIQEPRNVGAMLRVADWFGLPAVLASPDSADAYSPKAIQAGMGAFLRVPYARVDLREIKAQHPRISYIGADLHGANLFDGSVPQSGILVIGREGSGIRQEAASALTHRVFIPGKGGAESLNAAVATGIIVAQLQAGLWR